MGLIYIYVTVRGDPERGCGRCVNGIGSANIASARDQFERSRRDGVDTAIVNGALPAVGRPDMPLPGETLYFNGAPDGCEAAARFKDGTLRLAAGTGHGPVTIDLSAMPLVGRHNEENVAAAGLAALRAGAAPEHIQEALNRFEALPHRVTFVREHRGVRYYDDSKATNVDAVARALDSFDRPVVLIMGGRDKGGDYRVMKEQLQMKVCQLIVMGEAADRIAEALGSVVPVRSVDDMAAAVQSAAEVARDGQVVLLSPACASFDMYADYHQRGEDFCRHVQQLA